MSSTNDLLDGGETEALNKLAEAWNAFKMLARLHPEEGDEFRKAIHSAQVIIMARPVQRQINERLSTDIHEPSRTN